MCYYFDIINYWELQFQTLSFWFVHLRKMGEKICRHLFEFVHQKPSNELLLLDLSKGIRECRSWDQKSCNSMYRLKPDFWNVGIWIRNYLFPLKLLSMSLNEKIQLMSFCWFISVEENRITDLCLQKNFLATFSEHFPALFPALPMPALFQPWPSLAACPFLLSPFLPWNQFLSSTFSQ